MKELEKVTRHIDYLIGNERSNYSFAKMNRDSNKEAIKLEIKRLEIIKKQILSGNFGKLTDPIEFVLATGVNRYCGDYRAFNLFTINCSFNNDVLRCIKCGNTDYSIINKDGIVLKEFINEQPKTETYTIYFDGFVPTNLYKYIDAGNYVINKDGDKKLIYSPKNKR